MLHLLLRAFNSKDLDFCAEFAFVAYVEPFLRTFYQSLHHVLLYLFIRSSFLFQPRMGFYLWQFQPHFWISLHHTIEKWSKVFIECWLLTFEILISSNLFPKIVKSVVFRCLVRMKRKGWKNQGKQCDSKRKYICCCCSIWLRKQTLLRRPIIISSMINGFVVIAKILILFYLGLIPLVLKLNYSSMLKLSTRKSRCARPLECRYSNTSSICLK
jgi:hypothetical protein